MGNLCFIDTDIDGHILRSVVVGGSGDLHASIFDTVQLLFNESEVIVAKSFIGTVSISNILPCKLSGMQKGDVFTRLSLSICQQQFHALVPTYSCDAMDLCEGESVDVLLKINDIFINSTSA